MGSKVFITRSPNIKLEQDIRLGIRLKIYIEMNIIDIKEVEFTLKTKNCFGINNLDVIQPRSQRYETQTFESRNPLMSNLDDILHHG